MAQNRAHEPRCRDARRARADRRRPDPVPARRQDGDGGDARVRGGRRGRVGRGGRRAVRGARPRPGADGHQPAGASTASRPPGGSPTRTPMPSCCSSRRTRPTTCPRAPSTCGAAGYVNKEEFGPRRRPRPLAEPTDARTNRLSRARRPCSLDTSSSGMRPAMLVPWPGAESTVTRAAEGARRGRSCSRSRGRGPAPLSRIEAGAGVGDLEHSAPSTSRSVTIAVGAVAGVLARVLERLEAAEVHGGLDLLRVAADVLRLHRRGQRRARSPAARSASGRPRSMSSGG